MKMNDNWRGLMKILDVQHVRNGEVLWEAKDLLNTLHSGGELYLLTCAFDNDGTFPCANYYLGLDDRNVVDYDDMISDLIDEPDGNGYLRSSISSAGQFNIDLVNGVYRATSEVLTFSATGDGYGTVSNLFLTTASDNSGILIATAPLSGAISLANGDAINIRFALSLRDKNKSV